MKNARDGWLVCDSHICLYSEHGARNLDRCIRHGAILTWLGWGVGMSRREVRAKMAAEDKRVEAQAAKDRARIW